MPPTLAVSTGLVLVVGGVICFLAGMIAGAITMAKLNSNGQPDDYP